MNDKKICFISAVNDDEFYQECLTYINNLNIPVGYEIETKSIKNASSICNAYNQGILLSDAKYKVYLHQDTFILDKDFINKIIDIFNSNKSIGIMGMCGSKYIPSSGVWWECPIRFGKVYENRGDNLSILSFDNSKNHIEKAQGLDGLMLITQYDLPWREDIFDGWHFYDVSQCMEFIKSNYQVVIPTQTSPWCIHYCEEVSTANFDKYREIFLNEYVHLLSN